ncbi:MerR family transcriptional regulator [Desulfopila inferna]|uniref:MerR family transcriptional regulator n=1 Tax=Desulfopila inferna TaxID=468528 RepID=UPI0019666DD6|nr:MerR family transcriptional regulator [Desulfopila inferna]MBM9606728.1 MerR family transcriptional regulator [Desulfopila inferna]
MNNKAVGIDEIAKVNGVSEKQLRYWQEAGYINPDTVVCSEKTYRRYCKSDVALVKEIKRLLDEGYTLSRAVQKAEVSLCGQQ